MFGPAASKKGLGGLQFAELEWEFQQIQSVTIAPRASVEDWCSPQVEPQFFYQTFGIPHARSLADGHWNTPHKRWLSLCADARL
jgi:hypothetical protein